MTETARASCPTCSAVLTAVGAPCLRCSGGSYGPVPHQTPMPYQSGPYQQNAYPYGGHTPYPPVPYPYQQTPYQQTPYQQTPYQQTPYQQTPYQQTPFPPVPYASRPVKSSDVAVLLTLLWIGAGHLYLDRVGTGLVLMATHFVLGLILFVVFAPLGFVVWLAAAIGCSVWCSNLAGQINAGTVPPRETW